MALKSKILIHIGFFHALLVIATLLVLAFMPWSFEFEIPGDTIFAGTVHLSAADFGVFQTELVHILIVDYILVIAWLVCWSAFGIHRYREEKSKISPLLLKISVIANIMGVAGAVLDLTENGYQLLMLKALAAGSDVESGVYISWTIVLWLSYILPFIGAATHFTIILTRFASEQEKPSRRRTALSGIIITGIAFVSKFIPALSLVAVVWFLLWFIYLAYYFRTQQKSTRD